MIKNSWLVIDAKGARHIPIDKTRAEFANQTSRPWPAFTSMALELEHGTLTPCVLSLLAEKGLSYHCLPWPQDSIQDEEWWIGSNQSLSWLREPSPGDHPLHLLDVAEDLAELLRARGAYAHHNPDHGTLHLVFFEAGTPSLSWCDSIGPGPSFALTFHPDGLCTQEDPRQFALHTMGLPRDTPVLDRYDFVEFLLSKYQIHHFPLHSPELSPQWILRPNSTQHA